MAARIAHVLPFLAVLIFLAAVPAAAGPLGFPISDLAALAAAPSADPAAEDAPPLPADPAGWQTGLLRADRLQHASLAMTSGLMIGVTTEEPAWAVAGAMTLGLAKELIDMRDTGFDVMDLVADLLGAVAAGFATSAVTR